jgi:hypothetical protein
MTVIVLKAPSKSGLDKQIGPYKDVNWTSNEWDNSGYWGNSRGTSA